MQQYMTANFRCYLNASSTTDEIRSLCYAQMKAYCPKILRAKFEVATPKVCVVILHAYFDKQRFFSTQPQCCLTFSWIELQLLLSSCLIHKSIIILKHFIFTIFVSMSRPRSISVVSMWSFFHFHVHFHYDESYNLINTDTLIF